MTAVRRTVLVGASTLLLVVSLVTPASGSELNDVLAEASYATYTASRLVVSVWGGQTQVSREFVERANGIEMVRRDAGWSMAGNGRAVSMGEEPKGVAFVTHQRGVDSTRYTVIERGKALHMSRLCQIVEVMEGDIVRASFIVDDRSGAILVAEIYDGSGDLFRRTMLFDFRAYRTYEAPTGGSGIPLEVVMPEAANSLPDSLAGYQLVGTFSAPGGSEQGFYADGLFSFSLFVLDGRTVVSGFEEPGLLITGTGVYDLVPTAQAVRLHWQDGSNHFVLVGNLPPDHLTDVLGELPTPEVRGMWARWWQRLFG